MLRCSQGSENQFTYRKEKADAETMDQEINGERERERQRERDRDVETERKKAERQAGFLYP